MYICPAGSVYCSPCRIHEMKPLQEFTESKHQHDNTSIEIDITKAYLLKFFTIEVHHFYLPVLKTEKL